jgi:hypothetical protein
LSIFRSALSFVSIASGASRPCPSLPFFMMMSEDPRYLRLHRVALLTDLPLDAARHRRHHVVGPLQAGSSAQWLRAALLCHVEL